MKKTILSLAISTIAACVIIGCGDTGKSSSTELASAQAEIENASTEIEELKQTVKELQEATVEDTLSTDDVRENDTSSEKATESDEVNKQEEKEESEAIRKDVKEAIDSYEAFVDEYCKFMENYDASDLSLLVKYTELLSKEAEMSKEFEDIDEKELSDEEEQYYMEVSLRCSQKMLEAASKIK